jgi:leucyl aminopeptidase
LNVEIQKNPKLTKLDHLFVLLTEAEGKRQVDLPEAVASLADPLIERSRFSGRNDDLITLLSDGPAKVSLIGLGRDELLSTRSLRMALYAVGKIARRGRDKKIAVVLPYTLPGLDAEKTARLAADLLAHTDYRYDLFINKEDEKRPSIDAILIPAAAVPDKAAKRLTQESRAISTAIFNVREMGNAPPNEMTAARLAERAREIAREVGIKATIHDKASIQKMKMGGLLAVNRGSADEPRVAVLEYSPRGAKTTVCVVGKGITFDTGGISIKPSERMEEMKFDMCGAATAIAVVEAAARLALPVRVVSIIAATDNMPSGSAYKPGDIIRMMSGKTVEVVNTDAEGRMILGDVLHLAHQYRPDHIIDFATLTGACVIALGPEASGLFSNDRELARKLIDSGQRVGERVWELPEWDDYKELIRSEWADMKNSGGRSAGAITAAVFLKEFVSSSSWAHIDIAGTAWTDSETPRDGRGATGIGVRLMVDFLESLE